MDTESLYTLFKSQGIVTTDSRNCPPGSLFFALRGTSFDGNKFASQALSAGCSYAVVDDPSVAVDSRYLLVDDVLQALQALPWDLSESPDVESPRPEERSYV